MVKAIFFTSLAKLIEMAKPIITVLSHIQVECVAVCVAEKRIN